MRTRRLALPLLLAGLVAASAGAGRAASGLQGGVYRVGWYDSFGFTDNFDPTGEYLNLSFAVYSNLMLRALVGYDHVAGPAGNKLVPDLATALPTPTDGGTTYTFDLRSGVKFGPPVSRDVTSADVLFAMDRLASPADGGQYAFYYTVIKGWDAFAAGKAKTITGIVTPNPSTIVFHLTRPTGDFLDRMAMPATAPEPHEVAGCFSGAHANLYGRDVVSTGPYMIKGMDKVVDSSCAAIKPASGFDAQTTLTLVRNPNYDPATDSSAARQSLPDEFAFTVDSSLPDIMNRVEAGQLDDEVPTASPQTMERYSTTSSLKQYLHVNSGDASYYLTMNLTQPPFDDIHVRRAMNWVMDKTALVQAAGGPLEGTPARHIVPDTIFDNQLADYDPYKTPGEHGDVAKAKAAMLGSKYDPKHDGKCDVPQCKNVLLLADTQEVDQKSVPVVEADAAKIGITFHVSSVRGAFPTVQTVAKNIPIAEFPGWGKDYADPLTFFQPLFDGQAIIPQGNTNYSLVGITPAQCKKLGVTGNCKNVPNVDARIDRCSGLSGQPRLSCYESLDKYLMTEVVPWVPHRWANTVDITSSRVTQWSFDQFSGSIGYAHVAVKH